MMEEKSIAREREKREIQQEKKGAKIEEGGEEEEGDWK